METNSLIKRQFREINRTKIFRRLFYLFLSTYSKYNDFFRKTLGKKAILHHMEIHITEHCNLNCRGCAVFSNLVETERFADLELYRKDFARLHSLFDNIQLISLIGGEPLLHKELPRFIIEARQMFPKAKIQLVSNGLLYKTMSEELIAAIKQCDCLMRITLYKPVVPYKKKLELFFVSHGIKFLFSKEITQFFKYLDVSGGGGAFATCPQRRCNTLSSGFMATCYLPFKIKYFDRKFNESLSKQMNSALIDIHDDALDGFLLKEKLAKSSVACKHCADLEWFDWDAHKVPCKEDYCIEKREGK